MDEHEVNDYTIKVSVINLEFAAPNIIIMVGVASRRPNNHIKHPHFAHVNLLSNYSASFCWGFLNHDFTTFQAGLGINLYLNFMELIIV